MVKYVEENGAEKNNAQESAGAALTQETAPQTQGATNFTLGTASVFDRAFDWTSSSSMAADFVRILNEAAQKNEYLARFRFGTVVGISPDMGSAVYVAGEYKQTWLFGLIFFEKGQSIRFYENSSRQETYYTLAELVGTSVVDRAKQSMKEAHGIENAHFMVTNTVPDFSEQRMTVEWAQSLMGQILLGVFGRAPGYLGTMQPRKTDRFIASVAANPEGAVRDVNGHAHRADIVIHLEHTTTNQDQDNPTLLDSSDATEYPTVRAAGYTNLRFTGLQPIGANGVQDYKQLQGEVVVSLIDSQAHGAKAPYERQIVTLAAFAEIAQNGGWRDLAVNSFNSSDRKFSAMASYLSWGTESPDLSKINGSKPLIEKSLQLFAPTAAALVVHHRAGNGVGGLSNLLSEIAMGNENSRNQLVNILDQMFDAKGEEKFSQYLLRELGITADKLSKEHFVKAAVPTIDGMYVDGGVHRSLQSMDLVSVSTHLGDKQQDVMRYFHAQSYTNRELDGKAQRIYMAQLAAAMYGNRSLRLTGESLDMAVNPTFARCILTKVRERSQFQVTGVNAQNQLANSLFFNTSTESLVLSGVGNSNAVSAYSLGVQLSSHNL